MLAALMLKALWESSSALVKIFGVTTEDKFRSTVWKARLHVDTVNPVSPDAVSCLLSHEPGHAVAAKVQLFHKYFKVCSVGEGTFIIMSGLHALSAVRETKIQLRQRYTNQMVGNAHFPPQ